MKLGGYRSDGALRVLIPGGMTVLLLGDNASPPIDDQIAEGYGPWIEPPTTLSWQERQNLGKQLDRARTVPIQTFTLKFPFQKKEAVAEEAPAATEVAAAPVAAKPLTKGDLLAQITEIAKAREKEKADAAAAPDEKKGPKSTVKRLKLEYESEDREGDEKKDDKPVSEVAAGSAVPDHLKPIDKRPTMNFGGAGSGNFGHSGRPGEIGGSGEGGGTAAKEAEVSRLIANTREREASASTPSKDMTVEEHRAADAAFYDKEAADERAKYEKQGLTPEQARSGDAPKFAHKGRPAEAGGPGGSQYWSKMPADHQNAFAARVMAATAGAGGKDVSAVTSATPTPTGVRFKTLDGHAANAINRIADRARHRNTQRYDNQTGHYIVHVSTATKK